MARLIFVFLAALLAFAGPATAQSFNVQQQAEMRAIVRDYLVNNPDVLQDALDALAARKNADRVRRIQSDPRDFSTGPANAPIVVVEFFDYRCAYCHAAQQWVQDLIRTRRDVRVILKELPILGAASLEAAQASVAAMPQGRYLQFHEALMGFRGDLTPARIDELARRSGIDVARMRRSMGDPAVVDLLQTNRGLALDLADANGIATPTFFINGRMISGFRNSEAIDTALREATAQARNTQRRSR